MQMFKKKNRVSFLNVPITYGGENEYKEHHCKSPCEMATLTLSRCVTSCLN